MNPGSYEWKPNGLPLGVAGVTPKLSNHMNPMEPRCRSLSSPTKTPSMKRMSVWKSYLALAPVLRSVPVPERIRSAWPITPLKSVMIDGSEQESSSGGCAGCPSNEIASG